MTMYDAPELECINCVPLYDELSQLRRSLWSKRVVFIGQTTKEVQLLPTRSRHFLRDIIVSQRNEWNMEARFAVWVSAGSGANAPVTMAPFMITEHPLISRLPPVNNIISPPPSEDLQGDSRAVCRVSVSLVEGGWGGGTGEKKCGRGGISDLLNSGREPQSSIFNRAVGVDRTRLNLTPAVLWLSVLPSLSFLWASYSSTGWVREGGDLEDCCTSHSLSVYTLISLLHLSLSLSLCLSPALSFSLPAAAAPSDPHWLSMS